MADIQSLQIQIATLQAQISSLNQQQNVAIGAGNTALAQQIASQVAVLANQLTNAQELLQAAQTTAAVPTASAGQVAQDDGTTGIQNPATPPTTVTIQTAADGRIVPAAGTVNSSYVSTDGATASTLSLTNSQGTPASNTNANSSLVAAPATSPGVGAEREDNTAPTVKPAQQIISASFNQQIIPQPNVLDAYTSYTYGLSWYVLTPTQYTDFTNGSKNISTWSLLAQTGGASQIGRNQFFQLDYYMDNLIIDSYTPGKGSGLSHSAQKFEFTVTEPNGITLINNLHNAVTTLYKQANVTDKAAAYLQAQYCMVIRFYGYDEQGNLVNPIRSQGLVGYPGQGSTKSVVEKYYPFVIRDLTFRLVTKQIEYHVTCNPIPYQTALSQDRGSIPLQFEVSDKLVGKPVGTQYPTVDPGARTTTSAPATSAPGPAPATSVNDITASAGIDINGNFTGETASPFAVVAP
jgi:hypothetical protein